MQKPLLTVALVAALSGAAQADEASALYSRYHQAIEAARLCRDLDFTAPQIDAMAAAVADKIDHAIGAERLTLLHQAQRDAKALVEAEGCQSTAVEQLLALFDRELAPALP